MVNQLLKMKAKGLISMTTFLELTVMTSHLRLSCGRHIRRGDACIHIHNP